MNHHILSIHEIQQLFKTSKEGLHQSDAEERLLENGHPPIPPILPCNVSIPMLQPTNALSIAFPLLSCKCKLK